MAGNTIAPQMIYLAQLAATRSDCKCETCRLLRKATDSMIKEMLAEPSKDGAESLGDIARAAVQLSKTSGLSGEEV